MVGRCDRDGVDLLARQQLTKVLETDAILIAVLRVDHLGRVGAILGVNVCDGDHLNIRLLNKALQEAGTLPARTNPTHNDPITGRGFAVAAARRGRYDGGKARYQ